ncbi:phospholipase A2 [Nonomuraea sp. NPDC050556]|uniref:phospholipase A2 n=1 Tax=Nonomuraea sp. NPDC050556 TaxID=3364369 RepID=UPI0037A40026
MKPSRRLAAACALGAFAVLNSVTVANATPTPQPTSSTDATSNGRQVVKLTETSTVYSENGKTITELHTSPIRVQRDGQWADIDTDLMTDGDSLRPKVAKASVAFSRGGTEPFASIGAEPGKTVKLGWADKLPQPEISGNKATYRGVVGETGDLVATALPTGMRFDVILRAKPTQPVEIKVPVTAGGGLAVTGTGDRLKVTDGGKVVASSSTPSMWDSPADKAKSAAPGVGDVDSGDIDASLTSSAGGKVLILKPSMDFLNDPSTTYPVTVDPSVTLPLSNDTDVSKNFDGNNNSGGYLKAGTEADGDIARTYLRFNTTGLKVVTAAELKLNNIDAPSCGPKVGDGIQVRRVTSSWDAASQTWAPQPTNATDDAVTNTAGCAPLTWDIAPIVNKWAAGTPNHGLVLQSPTESKTANYRVFTSSENTDEGAFGPTLTLTSDEVITPGEGDDPADPGPADFKPGRPDPDTGSWITDATDVSEDGLLITRSHSAGARMDVTQANEKVLGPNWRLEPLGGMLGNRLKDTSANGYIEVALSSGTSSLRYIADTGKPGTFVEEDGTTVVKNSDGTFTQTGEPDTGLSYTWTKVGTEYLVTALTAKDGGITTISYDAKGRVSQMAVPATPMSAEEASASTTQVCTAAGPKCSAITLRYATATTGTATVFGDFSGQLSDITYDAAGDTAAIVVNKYAYDNAGRLREVRNLRKGLEDEPAIPATTYTYDAKGNITKLSTPENGAWTLVYEAVGKLKSATPAPAAPALRASTPAGPPGYPRCRYAADYMWGLKSCWAGPVPMEYFGKKLTSRWKQTPGRKAVVGVNNDKCTSPTGSKPPGFDFSIACDMHDFGYGVIYLRTKAWDISMKGAVDAVFYTTMRDYTCNIESNARIKRVTWTKRSLCRDWAYKYYYGVIKGGGWSMKHYYQY